MNASSVTALLATDGSEHANGALIVALRVIPQDARLLLVTVVPGVDPTLVVGAGHSGPVMTPGQKDRMLEAEGAAGRAILDETERLLTPTDVESHLLRGEPGPTICRFAEEIDADLVVLGTTGRGGLRRAVLGSVSDHVVRNAPCPVLTVS